MPSRTPTPVSTGTPIPSSPEAGDAMAPDTPAARRRERWVLRGPVLGTLVFAAFALVSPGLALTPGPAVRWGGSPRAFQLASLGLLLYALVGGWVFVRRRDTAATQAQRFSSAVIAVAIVTGCALFGVVQLLQYRDPALACVSLPLLLYTYGRVRPGMGPSSMGGYDAPGWSRRLRRRG